MLFLRPPRSIPAAACLLAVALHLAAPAARAGAPVAQLRPMLDSYGQATLLDNYRWMEQGGAELREYVGQFSAYTRGMLARVPERAAIGAEVAALSAGGPEVQLLVPDGEMIFFTRRDGGGDVARLYQRNATGGREQMLVDPTALPDARPGSAIVAISPSPDGNYIAYVLRAGGPETAEIRVHDTVRNVELGERLPGAAWAGLGWRLDGTGFYYTEAADDPGSAAHLVVRAHRLGTTSDRDTVLLDSRHLPFPFKGAPDAYPRLVLPPGSDYALAVVSDGVSPELTVYAVRLTELLQRPAPWLPIAPQGSGVTQVSVSRAIAFMLTHKDSPRGRVLTRDLADPDPAATRTVLAQTEGVVTGIAAASDALYAARRDGGTMRLLRLDYNDAHAEEVMLPLAGGVATAAATSGGAAALVADPRADGATMAIEGWTQPRAWMRYDRRTLKVTDLALTPKWTRDPELYRVEETSARAADGTAIPISLVMRADGPRDRPRPLLLEAYGAYGYSYDARFLPEILPFLDRGGVFAVAHVRGGGEGGDPWRLAGSGPNRPTAVGDLIACAAQLSRAGTTDSAHLAVRGVGAGVLTVAPAILRAPAVFRAAVLSGGVLNPLRAPGGPRAALFAAEFGSPLVPAQLPGLLKLDPYANITDGESYPATLVSGVEGDATEPDWQQAKFAARLAAAAVGGRPVMLSVSARGRAAEAAARADEIAFVLWQTGGRVLQEEAPVAEKPAPRRKRKK